MINRQVEEIAHRFRLAFPVRDPRVLSIALALEVARLDLVGSDESAENIHIPDLVSTVSEGLAHSTCFDVAVSGKIRNFCTNKGRVELLFCNILNSSGRAQARVVEVRLHESHTSWYFSVGDDGKLLSPAQRLASLDLAYESDDTGELRVGDLSLFVAKQIISFYEGDISVRPFGDGGSEVLFSIPKR